jgi:pimeloyl-ACP methyl ester carboxylesterase
MANLRPDRTLAMIHSGCGYSSVKSWAFARIAQYETQGLAHRREHGFEDYSSAFRDTELGKYFVEMFIERDKYADLRTIVDMFRALGEPDPDWLFDVTAPTLIITGSEDGSHRGALVLQTRIRECELVTIQGAGHACNIEKPWEWDRIALEFLGMHGLLQ